MNYIAAPRVAMRSRSPPEQQLVRWPGPPAITKREKLLRIKAVEEAALPRLRVMMLQDFVEDLRNDIYQYAEGECSRRSIEMTISAMRIVAGNLVKDYPKNKHAGLVFKRLNALYDLVCTRLFNPLCSRFDSVNYILEYIDEAHAIMMSILQWHSIEDSHDSDV